MDFTSDSYSKDPSTGVPTVESEVSVDNEELRLATLQDEKERLLEQRDALLNQIDVVRRKLQTAGKPGELPRPSQKDGQTEIFNESTLAALLARATARQWPQDVVRHTKINGEVSLQEELTHKYDALPLLNWQARITTLREMYPGVNVQNVSFDGGQQIATLRFEPCGFELTVEMLIEEACIQKLKVTSLSNKVRLALRSLVDHSERTQNVSHLFIGCNEYSRIWSLRSRLLHALEASFKPWQVSRTTNACVVTRDPLSVAVYYDIEFITAPFPRSQIRVELMNQGTLVPEGHDIAMALIQEYGVEHGIKEFIKAVLSV